jgi:hypothetical protein
MNQSELEWLLQDVNTRSVLGEVGFIPNSDGSDCLTWQMECQGVKIKMGAAPDMFGGWRCIATMNSPRTAMCNEFFFPPKYIRGQILKRLAAIWNDAFSSSDMPESLRMGQDYENYIRQKTKLNPGYPFLNVDSKIFRLLINRLRDRNLLDQPKATIRLSHIDGQLKIEVCEEVLYCPAHGRWFGAAEADLDIFLCSVPTMFYWGAARLQLEDGILTLNRNVIDARWIATEEPETEGEIDNSIPPSVNQSTDVPKVNTDQPPITGLCACFIPGRHAPTINHNDLGDYEGSDVTQWECALCGTAWVRAFFVCEAFTASGRWYHAPISKRLLNGLTANSVIGYLESTNFRIRGGSYFKGKVVVDIGPGPVQLSL